MYEYRQLLNYQQGSLLVPLATSDLTVRSTGFSSFPSDLSTAKYVPVCLGDPTTGAFEVLWATGHNAGSDTLTVVRAKENTPGNQQWPSGSAWYVGPTARDQIITCANRAALPADAHVGCRAHIIDENTYVERTLAQGWTVTPVTNPANFIGFNGAIPGNRVPDIRSRRHQANTDPNGYITVNVPNGPYPGLCLHAIATLGTGGLGIAAVVDQLDPAFARFRINRASGAWATSDNVIMHVLFVGY